MPAATAAPAAHRSASFPHTTAIARPARLCWELFCDAARAPEWVTVVSSARVRRSNSCGRPSEVAFLASLERATVGYTLFYEYRERDLGVSWTTAADATVQVAGWAQFTPLDPGTCVVTYELQLELGGMLSPWTDPYFDGDAATAVMSDFRDFARRASR